MSITLSFPGYMERSQGFTIPDNKRFYVFSCEDLVYYDLNTGEVSEKDNWVIDETRHVVILDNEEIPFVGVWGGTPLLAKEGLGKLSLTGSSITLIRENGTRSNWEVSNFSDDWAQVTFDSTTNGILYGAPYDFDYRYISVT